MKYVIGMLGGLALLAGYASAQTVSFPEPSKLAKTTGFYKATGFYIKGCIQEKMKPGTILQDPVFMMKGKATAVIGVNIDNADCSPSTVPSVRVFDTLRVDGVAVSQTDPIKADIVVGEKPTMCLLSLGDRCLLAGTKLVVE